MSYIIRPIDGERLPEALALVREVFMAFEAPEYPAEGVREFMDYIEHEHIADMMKAGELQMWGCLRDGRIVGMLACRGRHITLLFVSAAHHRRGIARRLLETMLGHLRSISPAGEITVNASPYGLDAYRRMGFCETDHEQVMNGIRYTPMKRTLKG